MDGLRRSALLTVTVMAFLVAVASASAMPAKLTPSGKLDFTFGSAVSAAGGAATGQKPESKLFHTPDARWWAVLGTSGNASAPAGVNLYELVDHVWRYRLHLPSSDPWEKADALFDAADSSLVVTLRDNRSLTTNPRLSKLYRLSYSGAGAWSSPSGPSGVTSTNPETVTVAKDSLGRLWTAWENGSAIKVSYTAPGGSSFASLSLPSPAVDPDDIAAVTAFGTAASGRKIGVMWSDQANQRFRFSWRYDSAPLTSDAWHHETAYGDGVGGCSRLCADDHVNLKVHGDGVYAAVKTSLNDTASPDPNDPLILLLRRSASGTWAKFRVSPVSQSASRPVVLLSPERNAIWVFAQKAFNDVYVWESPFSSPSFNPSAYSAWTTGSGNRNDPTSTKQLIPSGLGAVVETSLGSEYQYWHNEFLP